MGQGLGGIQQKESSTLTADPADLSCRLDGAKGIGQMAHGYQPGFLVYGPLEIGQIDPDQVHLPGIYVDRIVVNASPEKRIEQRTIRQLEGN